MSTNRPINIMITRRYIRTQQDINKYHGNNVDYNIRKQQLYKNETHQQGISKAPLIRCQQKHHKQDVNKNITNKMLTKTSQTRYQQKHHKQDINKNITNKMSTKTSQTKGQQKHHKQDVNKNITNKRSTKTSQTRCQQKHHKQKVNKNITNKMLTKTSQTRCQQKPTNKMSTKPTCSSVTVDIFVPEVYSRHISLINIGLVGIQDSAAHIWRESHDDDGDNGLTQRLGVWR